MEEKIEPIKPSSEEATVQGIEGNKINEVRETSQITSEDTPLKVQNVEMNSTKEAEFEEQLPFEEISEIQEILPEISVVREQPSSAEENAIVSNVEVVSQETIAELTDIFKCGRT